MDTMEKIELIRQEFIKNRKILSAVGDETRQNIITELLGCCNGIRVGEITSRTHLSRPAVSHHLRILLDANLVTLEKQGTRNYYSLNIGEEFQGLLNLIRHIAEFKIARESGQLTGMPK